MAKHPDYPGVSSFTDNRGKLRWRHRKSGTYLPGEPHSPEFDAAYQAVIEGRAIKAEVVRHPRSAFPASLKAAWQKLQQTAKWQKLDPESQCLYARYIEEFMAQPAGGGMTLGDGPISDFRARHAQAAMDQWAATPHKAKILLVVLRKMMKVAIREEWIEYDPTAGAERPDTTTKGKEAWPPHICAMFEKRWPIGSAPRTAYELARWLGTRRSDVASVRWDQLVTRVVDGVEQEGFVFVQHKGRNRPGAAAKFHPVSPMLAEALSTLDRTTGTVLVQADGRPYRIKSMTAMMWHWRRDAGIPSGYSFHGLRHAMGAAAVDAGATPHEVMDILGHATVSQGGTYTKQRDQVRSSTLGIRKVVKLVRG